MSVNDVDRGFWLGFHARRRRHRHYMVIAETHLRNAYWMKEQGLIVAGIEELSACTNALARCGCPVILWPPIVREKIPVDKGGTA